jgi:hypothetical protein
MPKKTSPKKKILKARVAPKRSQKAEGPKKLGTCFVISPFSDWFDSYYDTIFEPAILSSGLHACRADDLYRPSSIIHDIWGYVRKAEVLLADLTGKNPNVLYELGLAHAAGKPVVMVTQSLEDVPFDLRNLRVIPYDLRDPAWGTDLKGSIELALREVLASPQTAVPPVFLREQEKSKVPKVTPLERRVLELSQQVESLRRSQRVSSSPIRTLRNAEEARDLIKHYLRTGMPKPMIVERVERRGPSIDWIERELDKLTKLPPDQDKEPLEEPAEQK